jgi:hypothetical protein
MWQGGSLAHTLRDDRMKRRDFITLHGDMGPHARNDRACDVPHTASEELNVAYASQADRMWRPI